MNDYEYLIKIFEFAKENDFDLRIDYRARLVSVALLKRDCGHFSFLEGNFKCMYEKLMDAYNSWLEREKGTWLMIK